MISFEGLFGMTFDGHFTPHDWSPMTNPIQDLSLVKKTKTIQAHFPLEDEGPRAQRIYRGWKVYMESKLGIVFHGLLKFSWGPPPKGRLNTILANHVKSLRQLVRPLHDMYKELSRSQPLALVWSDHEIANNLRVKFTLKTTLYIYIHHPNILNFLTTSQSDSGWPLHLAQQAHGF